MSPSTKKLIETGSKHKKLFLFSCLCMFFAGLTNILPSWLIKVSVDGLQAMELGRDKFSIFPKQVLKWGLPDFMINAENLHLLLPATIILVVFIEAFFKFLHQYNVRKVGLLIVKDLREQYHEHLSRLSLSTQAKFDSGSLTARITSDLNSFQSWIAEAMTNIVNESFKAFFLFAWLLILDWKLTVFSAIVLPMFAIPVVQLGKGIRKYSKSGQDFIGTLTTFVNETLQNQRVIKAFNLEKRRQKDFVTESIILYKIHKKWILFMAAVSPMTNVIAAFGIAGILYFGLSSVHSGYITLGEFSSFFVTSLLLYDPVKRLGRASTIMQSALGVVERVYDILDEEIQTDKLNKQVNTELDQHKLAGDISFRNVSYHYQQLNVESADQELVTSTQKAKPTTTLFTNLNLEIKAKTSVALVGPSGSGKTTLLSLLPRFYEVDSGDILIDQINIRDLSLAALREQIAIVTQEALLFNGTIKENILLGKQDASQEEIYSAAEKAHVIEFAQDLNNGLNSNIGEGGRNLSVGQRQRVALARAFLNQAGILILDEPTSALDNESEAYIKDSIKKLMEDRTVLIIAHRLDTIKNCDQIVYLEDGHIREVGTHDELMKKDTAYARLVKEF